MIIAGEKCGCPSKHINFPASGPLSQHNEPSIPSKPSDQNYHGQFQSHCCSQPNEPEPCNLKIPEKNVSEITEMGIPYKEIEAIINNNRMVLRIQKAPIEDDWNPPCNCETGNGEEAVQSVNAAERYGQDITFRKAEDHQKPSLVHQEQTTGPGGSAKRTITVISHPNDENAPPELLSPSTNPEDDEKLEKRKGQRPIDLEENPNIFILKIRKKRECSGGRENIDLEFRTPRPWLPKPKIMKPKKLPTNQPTKPPENVETNGNGNDEKPKNGKNGKNGKKKKNGKDKKKKK